VPAGTSSAIVLGAPADFSAATGLSACPEINPADKKIKAAAEKMGRKKLFLSFDVGSINSTAKGKDSLKGRSCKVEPERMPLGMRQLSVTLHQGLSVIRSGEGILLGTPISRLAS